MMLRDLPTDKLPTFEEIHQMRVDHCRCLRPLQATGLRLADEEDDADGAAEDDAVSKTAENGAEAPSDAPTPAVRRVCARCNTPFMQVDGFPTVQRYCRARCRCASSKARQAAKKTA